MQNKIINVTEGSTNLYKTSYKCFIDNISPTLLAARLLINFSILHHIALKLTRRKAIQTLQHTAGN